MRTLDNLCIYCYIYQNRVCCLMCGSRGGTGGLDPPPPLKKHKNTGFLSNTGPDPLKNHKAAKPAFNVGPSSTRQRNAISMAFSWRADDGPLLVLFGSSFPLSKKKKLDPLWRNFLDPRMCLIKSEFREC